MLFQVNHGQIKFPTAGRSLALLVLFVLTISSNTQGQGVSTATINTDKARYSRGQLVNSTVTNQSDHKIYVWYGPCSLILESYEGTEWRETFASWSGCPSCVQREHPHPLFLTPSSTEVLVWDQILTWCEEGKSKHGSASGRFRFMFRYAEDEPKCHSAIDPFKCWLLYHDKKWHSAYSNEFIID